jgi:hypothetical protein
MISAAASHELPAVNRPHSGATPATKLATSISREVIAQDQSRSSKTFALHRQKGGRRHGRRCVIVPSMTQKRAVPTVQRLRDAGGHHDLAGSEITFSFDLNAFDGKSRTLRTTPS